MLHSLLTQRINTILSMALLASVALSASLLIIRANEAAEKEWRSLSLPAAAPQDVRRERGVPRR